MRYTMRSLMRLVVAVVVDRSEISKVQNLSDARKNSASEAPVSKLQIQGPLFYSTKMIPIELHIVMMQSKAFKIWRHYQEDCKHEVFVLAPRQRLDTKGWSSCQVKYAEDFFFLWLLPVFRARFSLCSRALNRLARPSKSSLDTTFRIDYPQSTTNEVIVDLSRFLPRRSESSTGYHPLLTIASLSEVTLLDLTF